MLNWNKQDCQCSGFAILLNICHKQDNLNILRLCLPGLMQWVLCSILLN